MIRFLIGSVFQIVSLAIFAGIGWGLFHLLSYLGWNVVPVLFVLSLIFKRLATLLWINSRYFRDKSSTIDRIYNPDIYPWRRVPFLDKMSLWTLRALPDLKDYTDFKRYPLPFNMWEGERSFSYLRKTFLWNLLVISTMFLWYWYGVGDSWEYIVLLWSSIVLVGSIVSRKSKFSQGLRYYYEKRFRLLSMSTAELVEKVSLGLVRRSFYITRRRLLVCIVISFLGFSILIIKSIVVNLIN